MRKRYRKKETNKERYKKTERKKERKKEVTYECVGTLCPMLVSFCSYCTSCWNIPVAS
jgi:hypothetical protein